MLTRVEEILLEAPLHEHEVWEGPHGMRMEGRIMEAFTFQKRLGVLAAPPEVQSTLLIARLRSAVPKHA